MRHRHDAENSDKVQSKRLMELARRQGYEIVKWNSDNGASNSRSPGKRAAWMQMLAEAPTAQWEAVLVNDRSRYSRFGRIKTRPTGPSTPSSTRRPANLPPARSAPTTPLIRVCAYSRRNRDDTEVPKKPKQKRRSK